MNRATRATTPDIAPDTPYPSTAMDEPSSTTGEPLHAGRTSTMREDVFRGDSGRSATALLRDLVNDVALLFQKELALAATEITQSVQDARKGVTGMVSGGAVLYAGLLFLLAAACFGLARVMPAWAATLIVGAVVALIGYIMVRAGRKRLEPTSLVPERTVESMRKDREAMRRQTT